MGFRDGAGFRSPGPAAVFFGKRGRKRLGEFQLPSGLFIDHDDRVFVVDSFNRRVQVFRYHGLPKQAGGRASEKPRNFVGLRCFSPMAAVLHGQTPQEDVLGIHNLGPGSPGPVKWAVPGVPVLPRSALWPQQHQPAEPAAVEPEALDRIELHSL
jgi:hypothetical protein